MVDPSPDPTPTSSWLPWKILRPALFVILALLVVLLIGVIFFGWLKDFLIFGTFDWAVKQFVNATGMSIYLVKGILTIALIPFFLALREIGMVPLFKRAGRFSKPVAYAIAVCYVSAYFLAMYFFTKDLNFVHGSEKVVATKYCAETPEGTRCFDTPGIDPKYGIILKPVTPEMVAIDEKRKRGNIPKPLVFGSISEITFFDPLNGKALVWFSQSAEGELTLFSSSGYDSATEQELVPVTPQVVEAFKRQQQSAEAKRQADEKQAQEASRNAVAQGEKARAEAQESSFRNSYVNALVRKDSARKTAAPLILGDSEGATSLQTSFSTALQEKGIASVDGIFKPNFLRDGTADRIFGGDLALASRLRLNEKVDYLLLVRSNHSMTSAADLSQGLRTATLNLDMKCIDVVNLRTCGSRSVSVKGVGFSDSEAIQGGLHNAGSEIEKFVKSLGI
jgi:hypothetical protein